MEPNPNTELPVSQERPQDPDVDLWEPPFERWLRLADSLLGNVPPVPRISPREN
jgi:hypothetical protein